MNDPLPETEDLTELNSREPGHDRRTFLRYAGVGVSSLVMGWLPSACAPSSDPSSGADDAPEGIDALLGRSFTSPAYPVPLPSADGRPLADPASFRTFEVRDDLVLPNGVDWRVVAQWGERFGADGHRVTFGSNADYTGLLPIPGTDDYWLFVNHEYVSPRPWLDAFTEVYGEEPPEVKIVADAEARRGAMILAGWRSKDHRLDLDRDAAPEQVVANARRLARRFLGEMGVSVLHVRRRSDEHFEVVVDSMRHRRIAATDRENVAPEHAPRLTGPATSILGDSTPGTMCNCSGGTSPWGTFLTCEENIQYQVADAVDARGDGVPVPRRFSFSAERTGGNYDFSDPRPATIDGNGLVAAETPLDGRQYGWVAEVDPDTGAMRKHTALGRFRHENITLRAEAGRKLAAYMGDDRRGGHVWKYVSEQEVQDVSDPANSALLTRGLLHAARFESDFRGRWLPLALETPLTRPTPEHCADGFMRLPSRGPESDGGTVRVGTAAALEAGRADLTADQWCESVATWASTPFEQCTLEHLVAPALRDDPEKATAVLLLDAFAMANAIGATPTARPEDLEVHPIDSSIFVAFTDATGGSDGSPDVRLFPDSDRSNSRQYGALYRLVDDIDAEEFEWGKFLASGNVAEAGGGFACADNLAFDPQANLWMVTDISTTSQNFPVRIEDERTQVGMPLYPGVFGNNALFRVAADGPDSGIPKLFGIGPVDSELTGPTFSEDGRTLLLSVQHPGESGGTRRAQSPSESIEVDIHGADGEIVRQARTVPVGSNFPSGRLDTAPRSCVVSICAKSSS